MPQKPKRLPLPKRFSAAITEKAYAKLRDLNADWHFGNNYLLTILLENFDDVIDEKKFQQVMETFIAEYGQPDAGGMKPNKTQG
ncbi:MAG: hypothetical protein RIE06_21735 [Roseibium album]|uniref:hypothetical protein n=1 Tax=Roseibium album TaxID=311410 RepID=UPI0032EF8A97